MKIHEVARLRWLAVQFPKIENPQDDTDKMCNCIHLYCTAAADTLEKLAENFDLMGKINDRLCETIDNLKAERDAMAADLKERGGCDTCRHCDVEFDQEPCDSCRLNPIFPAWEWKGEQE